VDSGLAYLAAGHCEVPVNQALADIQARAFIESQDRTFS
jgi:hypothetical protein